MSKFSNLTIDYRQMLGVTIQDRVQLAKSPLANEIFGNMSPTEIAKLFPTYYQQNIPTLAGFVGATTGVGAGFNAGGQQAGSSGGGSNNGSVGSSGQNKAKQKTPESVAELISAAAFSKKLGTSMTPGERRLMELIASGEGGYNSSNGGTANGQILNSTHNTQRNGKPLEQLTIGEINQYMNLPIGHPDRLFAVGKYQLTKTGAWPGAVAALGLKDDDVLTPEIQEKMGLYAVMEKRPAVGRYIRGETDDIMTAQQQLALEFASIPVPVDMEVPGHGFRPAGASAYGAGNSASHSIQDVEQALIAAREDYKNKQDSDYAQENLLKAPGEEQTAEPVLQITPENIASVNGLDPRLIDYVNTLDETQKTKFFNDMNILGNVNEINQKAKSGLDRMNYSPQGTATNVGDAINQDPIAFWQERNPNGARIEDIDRESLLTAMMAAMKLEADNAAKGTPKRVEFYGNNAGVREDPSLSGSKHGVNFKEAIDFAIYDVDPETGQKMQNQSGAYGNYSNKPNHGGVDGDAFALYHELKQNQELARIHLAANEGNMDYANWGVRDGMLFSDVEWDAMHSDRSAGVNSIGISDHTSPIGRGSVAGGLSESALLQLGIDPNSDAGQKLMTGVAERFGDTPEKLAESARKAYAPQPVAQHPNTTQLDDGTLSDYGIENMKLAPPDPTTANTSPVVTETTPTAEPAPTSAPAPEPPTDIPTMSQGGFIPQKDDLEVTDTKTGETVAMINDGEVQKGLEPKGSGVEVQSNEKVNAKELANSYEPEPEDAPPASPEAAKQEVVQQQGKMTAPMSDSQSHQNIGHIPYQSTMDLVHNSLLRAYDIDRRRTGYGNIS